MATSATIRVRGYRELSRTFKEMGREVQKEARDELKAAGEPVRAAAEANAVTSISNIGDNWSRMRLGVTSKVVYIAPRARSRGGSRRPNLAVLLLNDAMIPALGANETEIVHGLEQAINHLADRHGF